MKIARFIGSWPNFILLGLSLWHCTAYAKRLPPKEVPPLIYQGIKYSLPHWGAFSGRKQNGQYIEARSAECPDKLLWDLRVYKVNYDPKLEYDVQDIFITSLKLVDGNLEVVNEAGDRFLVDLSKRKLIKGANREYGGKPRSPAPAP